MTLNSSQPIDDAGDGLATDRLASWGGAPVRPGRRVRLEYCSCGHLPTEHVIAAGATGFGIYGCEALTGSRRACACGRYTPQFARPADLDTDEELAWRAA